MFQFKCLEIRGHRNIFGMESFWLNRSFFVQKIVISIEVIVNNIFIKDESN